MWFVCLRRKTDVKKLAQVNMDSYKDYKHSDVQLFHKIKHISNTNEKIIKIGKTFPLRRTLEIPSLWKVFSSQSSLRRFAWAFVFFFCTIMFLYQTWDRVEKLINTPKSARVKLEYEEILEFPAVTVCPGYQFRDSILQKFRHAQDRNGCISGQKYCSWDFYWNMATHTETIIKSCKYKNRNCVPGTEERGTWSRRLTSLGRCFTYQPSEPIYSAGDSSSLEIQVDPMLWDKSGETLFNGIRVYIHNPKEIPLAEINGININQGSTVHFALRAKEYQRVNDVKHNPCTDDPSYIQSKCILKCIYDTTQERANSSCGSPFMKDFDVKTCRTRKEISFFNENFQYLIYNGSIWNGCVHRCPQICKQRIYTPITTSLGFSSTNNSLVNVTIYFKDMWLEKIVEEWDYNVDEFISDTGGSINLFLGASFYTIIQVSDYILALLGHYTIILTRTCFNCLRRTTSPIITIQ